MHVTVLSVYSVSCFVICCHLLTNKGLYNTRTDNACLYACIIEWDQNYAKWRLKTDKWTANSIKRTIEPTNQPTNKQTRRIAISPSGCKINDISAPAKQIYKLWWEDTTKPAPVLRIAVSRGFSELTRNVIRSSHGHSTPSLNILWKSVQPLSRNLADKETNKQTKKSIENNTPSPIMSGRGNEISWKTFRSPGVSTTCISLINLVNWSFQRC